MSPGPEAGGGFAIRRVAPETRRTALAVVQLLLSRGGEYVTLCAPDEIGECPVVIDTPWPALAALAAPGRDGVRVLTLPWDGDVGAPADEVLRHMLSVAPPPIDVCALVTSSSVDAEALRALAESARLHIVILETGDPPLPPEAAGGALRELIRDALPEDASAATRDRMARRVRAEAMRAAFRDRLADSPRRPPVTMTLIGACLAVFALMALDGVSPFSPSIEGLIRWGANGGFLVARGEWWRLLTATFIHVGFIHLALNMWCLWVLGRFVERLYGSVAFAGVYFFAGYAGSLASAATHPARLSAGASGAIFGVCGALAAFLLIRRRVIARRALRALVGNTLFFIGINLAIGFSIPIIDNSAHIGGLVGGFVAGLLLCPRLAGDPARDRAVRAATAAGMVLALVVATLLVDKFILNTPTRRVEFFLGEGGHDLAWAEKRIRELPALEQAAAATQDDSQALLVLREVAARKKRLAEARRRIEDMPEAPVKEPSLDLLDALSDCYRALISYACFHTQRAKSQARLARQAAYRAHEKLATEINRFVATGHGPPSEHAP